MSNQKPPDPGGGKSPNSFSNIGNISIVHNEMECNDNDDNNTKSNTQKTEEIYKNRYDNNYLHLYKAPFYVYIQHKEKNIGRLHPMAIGKLLYEQIKNPKNTIKEIIKMGSNRVKVVVRNMQEANNLVSNTKIRELGYIAYVPKHCTEIRGVVKRVYTSLTDTYLRENSESESGIKSCYRILRKVSENGEKITKPTGTVIMTFLVINYRNMFI